VKDEKVKLDDISVERRARKPDVYFAIILGLGTSTGELGWQWMHQTVDIPEVVSKGLFVGSFMYICRRLWPVAFRLK